MTDSFRPPGDPSDWRAAVGLASILGPGLDARRLAADLGLDAAVVERQFGWISPTDRLARQLSAGSGTSLDQVISGLADLPSDLGSRSLGGAWRFEDLQLPDVSSGAGGQVQAKLRATAGLINRYPAMRIDEVIDDTALTDTQRRAEITRRTELVDSFFAENADVLHADLTAGGPRRRFKWAQGASRADKTMVLSTVRTYQRMFALDRDPDSAAAVVEAGYHSAIQLASVPADQVAELTGLDADKVVRLQESARGAAVATVSAIGLAGESIADRLTPRFANNLGEGVAGYFHDLPGFDELFGNQDYCQCGHCKSIYGPAAYFADLMSFVEQKITQAAFRSKPDHGMRLEGRRPDLAYLELSCENTTDSIPYLAIVNEVLENAVAQEAGHSGSLSNRDEVEKLVYGATLPAHGGGFETPLNLPFEELRTYLAHYGRDFDDLADACGIDGRQQARLELGLSPKEYNLIVGKRLGRGTLQRTYRMKLPGTGTTVRARAPEVIDSQEILKAVGVNRTELGALLATRFVTADGNDEIEIVGRKEDRQKSLQNDIEDVRGLTLPVLDRLHRFVRLQRATGWELGELDLVLTLLAEVELSTGIDAKAVDAISRMIRIQREYPIAVEELVALWSPMLPTHPIVPVPSAFNEVGSESLRDARKDDRLSTSLFHRLFDVDPDDEDGLYPEPSHDYLHPALADSPDSADRDHLARLRAATSTSETELLDLITAVASALEVDLAGDQQYRAFPLSADNLAVLYRHARLARLLRIPISELSRLLALALGKDGYVASLDDLERVIEFHGEVASSGIDLDRLEVATSPDEPLAWSQVASELVESLASSGALEFDDGGIVAALLPEGHDELEVRAVLDHNRTLFDPVASGRFRLAADADPAIELSSPPSDTGPNPHLLAAVQRVLASHHGDALLRAALPETIGFHPSALVPLLAMARIDLSTPLLFAELRGDSEPEQLARLLSQLGRLVAAMPDQTVFPSDLLASLADDPRIIGVEDWAELTVQQVLDLSFLRSRLADHEVDDSAPWHLHDVFDRHRVSQGFNEMDIDAIAGLLGHDPTLIESLRGEIKHARQPIPELRRLQAAADLAHRVGLDGRSMTLACETGHEALSEAASTIQAAFRARYPDEEEWLEKVTPFEDALRTIKRDALVAYLIDSKSNTFNEPADLYRHYLLDVEMDGCARTSRIAAAIASVQLYVKRCQMNLERGAERSNEFHVGPHLIKSEEWSWRKHYRLWEANRKIFLYPENYLEPELRHDKTPLFKELEEELLANELNDQSIFDAYARYLRGFEEVSRLKIVGSYHEKDRAAQEDVLHLIGVTSDDPPIHYHRRIENAHFSHGNPARSLDWGVWERLDVQIPVRTVSPIVHRGQLYLFWIRYVTQPLSEIDGGDLRFGGYRHKVVVDYAKKGLDGRWAPSQSVGLPNKPFSADESKSNRFRDQSVLDPKDEYNTADSGEVIAPIFDHRGVSHTSQQDSYTLSGPLWDRMYVSIGTDFRRWGELPVLSPVIVLRGCEYQLWSPLDEHRLELDRRFDSPFEGVASAKRIPAYARGATDDPDWQGAAWMLHVANSLQGSMARRLWIDDNESKLRLRATQTTSPSIVEPYAEASILVNPPRGLRSDPHLFESISSQVLSARDHDDDEVILSLPTGAEVDVVNGSVRDAIIQSAGEILYLKDETRDDDRYRLTRLNTTAAGRISSTLFQRGLAALLSTETQLSLVEEETRLENVDDALVDEAPSVSERKVDFDGAMGVYLREIFFHIPFLIADHLNSQGRFEDAQRWYHYIFDPTAEEMVDPVVDDSDDDESARQEADRVWRYREFRDLTLPTLRERLDDDDAIAAYRKDPFNPHAVARTRMSAYQKAIVMKYVDNLVDWGDDLFARSFSQANPEYLSEATLLYSTAQDILGPRPAELGPCTDDPEAPLTVASLRLRQQDSEFISEVESVKVTPLLGRPPSAVAGGELTASQVERSLGSVPVVIDRLGIGGPTMTDASSSATGQAVSAMPNTGLIEIPPISRPAIINNFSVEDRLGVSSWATALLNQMTLAFCVPDNDRMLKLWDRVEDGLFKIRHCLDPDGNFRQLPLFAPPIDPALLVAGAAAGIDLSQLLADGAGSVPAHRFQFLVERARNHAATVQSLGGALLAALEKRDGEQLSKLQNTHRANLLALTTEERRRDLETAVRSKAAADERREAARFRVADFERLISAGNNQMEEASARARRDIKMHRSGQQAFERTAGVSRLIAQIGAPTAITFGGKQFGAALESAAREFAGKASESQHDATTKDIEASQARRKEGWQQQQNFASNDYEVASIECEIAALRVSAAEHALRVHEETQSQQDEVMEFFADKFTGLGLYTHLSRTLHGLYRSAYNDALKLARQAEQAFRFERPGEDARFIGGEWDASHAGLLAGEKLQQSLNALERRYIETEERQAEITQHLSLNQVDPWALLQLRETGKCEFKLPEFFFDLYYPGHYRRRLRAVRLTIPCVVGPYTNVSAKLRLEDSWIRPEASSGEGGLRSTPVGRKTSAYASSAQNDAGMFELNFRDERYLPFEGAGAASEWSLELPTQLRTFDYGTITDVILHLSYTAEEGGDDYRKAVQDELVRIRKDVTKSPIARAFSLKGDFPTAFQQLLQAGEGETVSFNLEEKHFPLLLQDLDLSAAEATLVLRFKPGTKRVETVKFAVNDEHYDNGFVVPDGAGMAGIDVGAAFTQLKTSHTIGFRSLAGLDSGDGTPDPTKFEDVILLFGHIAVPS